MLPEAGSKPLPSYSCSREFTVKGATQNAQNLRVGSSFRGLPIGGKEFKKMKKKFFFEKKSLMVTSRFFIDF